jgi:hypothetical protein
MLAERVPGLLPDLDLHDALEVSAVHSLAGFNLADELITRPPYSDPHHSASVASIVGGGQRMARPGAISCAHKGVLFLDDSTEAQIHPIQAVKLAANLRLEPLRGRTDACSLASPRNINACWELLLTHSTRFMCGSAWRGSVAFLGCRRSPPGGTSRLVPR